MTDTEVWVALAESDLLVSMCTVAFHHKTQSNHTKKAGSHAFQRHPLLTLQCVPLSGFLSSWEGAASIAGCAVFIVSPFPGSAAAADKGVARVPPHFPILGHLGCFQCSHRGGFNEHLGTKSKWGPPAQYLGCFLGLHFQCGTPGSQGRHVQEAPAKFATCFTKAFAPSNCPQTTPQATSSSLIRGQPHHHAEGQPGLRERHIQGCCSVRADFRMDTAPSALSAGPHHRPAGWGGCPHRYWYALSMHCYYHQWCLIFLHE